MIFACKEAFASLGLEQIKPSHAHASQDCTICRDPLRVHPSHDTDEPSKFHVAVRVVACGHILGEECLDSWLDVGNTCPTCNRILFEATGDSITQQDVNNVLLALGPTFGEETVMNEVARLTVRQEEEHARLRQIHEVETAKMRARESQARNEGFTLSGEDFLDSEEEANFSEEEDVEFVEEHEDTSDSTA